MAVRNPYFEAVPLEWVTSVITDSGVHPTLVLSPPTFHHRDAVVSYSFFPSGESRELAEDVRALFEDLAASLTHEHRAFSGECRPPLDVRETDRAVEITMDVSGVPGSAIRVLFRAGLVLIAGEKAPLPVTGQQSFLLVEREFGRFARAVKVTGAFDLELATATMESGELTIVLPKRPDRRGRAHRIPVTATDSQSP